MYTLGEGFQKIDTFSAVLEVLLEASQQCNVI